MCRYYFLRFIDFVILLIKSNLLKTVQEATPFILNTSAKKTSNSSL